MARLPRLAIAGVPHYVWLAGHAGESVRRDAHDLRALRTCLAQYAQELGIEWHAYAFPENGVHLLFTPPHASSVSMWLQSFGRKYTRQFNVRHGRTGTLWDGRYRSTVLEPGQATLQAMVYMDGLVVSSSIRGDAVSSHPHYVGEVVDRWVTPPAIYWALGNTPFAREAAYRALVIDGLRPEVAQSLVASIRHGWAFGSEVFVSGLQQQTERRLSRGRVGRPARATL